MRIPARRRGSGLGFNLTAMIDVVFNLIVFFLVASHFSQGQMDAPVNLPKASQAGDGDDDPRRLTITVTSAGQWSIAGKPAKLAQVQAWPGSAAETSTLVRVLDPAVRVSRKYGAPVKTLPLGGSGAEVWVYPAADAAFVVTAPDDKDRRSVGAVVVGL